MPYNSDIKLFKENTILVQSIINEKYQKVKESTQFGIMTKGTPYADYAIYNKFMLDSDSFIEKKTGNAKFTCAFVFENQTFGVWFDYSVR